MIKNICTQIRNCWKKNLWIAIELLLVFCLTWYMVDYFFVLEYNKNIPSHRDLEHTYMIGVGSLPQTHEEYNEAYDEPAVALENYRRFINRLKGYPGIEAVAIASDHSSVPALGGGYNLRFFNTADTTIVAETKIISFIPEEDYFRVFRHTTDNGKTPVSVTDYNWNNPNEVLITRMMEEKLFPGESAVGKTVARSDYPDYHYRIMGVIDDIKDFRHLRPYISIFMSDQLNESTFRRKVITIRSKGDISPAQFTEAFKKEMAAPLRIGNYYLGDVTDLSQMEEETDYKVGITNQIRMRAALMLFLLINIMLCVLGTFWYRVNVRRGEIGVRRAMGSDTANIRKLFIVEGIILLTAIIIPAMLIEMQFILGGLIPTMGEDFKSYGEYLPDHTVVRFLITNAITWLILAVMVVLGIWYPTYSASRITPVEALRDE